MMDLVLRPNGILSLRGVLVTFAALGVDPASVSKFGAFRVPRLDFDLIPLTIFPKLLGVRLE